VASFFIQVLDKFNFISFFAFFIIWIHP